MTDRLYRLISDDEFRGEGYFEATFKSDEVWIEVTPPQYKGAFRKGDYLIVQSFNDNSYLVCAVKRDNEWRDPTPGYAKPAQYIVPAEHLEIGIAR